MNCTCGHHRDFHLSGRGRCMVDATTVPCGCVFYVSRASYAAALPVRGFDWLLRKAFRL